ncbi:MAG: hypothetical protein FRX48_03462 [Lasallia pustulata]|uniref:Uncharacterized protein n=1 Tax=Lasallia pustulata TaxID=136370 RepID=A0A5M8PUY6_9LECA|nr:MAG: hypothetical protein FRX48_03462 [Lasallia pustulata]
MRWLAILLTSFLSIAHAQDLVRSGNYQILFCGAGTANFRASQLQASLPNVLNNLKAVLADVKLGTKSTHGFAAFFKTDESIPTVQKSSRPSSMEPRLALTRRTQPSHAEV